MVSITRQKKKLFFIVSHHTQPIRERSCWTTPIAGVGNRQLGVPTGRPFKLTIHALARPHVPLNERLGPFAYEKKLLASGKQTDRYNMDIRSMISIRASRAKSV